jgi:DNA-binding transcriptional LysR family regulator
MKDVHDALDLNLLRVVDAVLTEGSATGAATRLGVTQSAVSHALGRARDALGDAIVVRGGAGLVPTPRGEALREPLRRALAEIEVALAPQELDPETFRGELVVACPDYSAEILMPQVAARLGDELPGLDLVVRAPVDVPARDLAAGDVDLVVGRAGLDVDQGLYAQRLFDDGFCCLLRGDHPALSAPFDVDAYCALRHVLVAPSGAPGGIVDVRLEEVGRTRRVAVRVAHFLAAASFVAASDAVCTLPRRIAERHAAVHGLAVLDPPLALPGFQLAQIWHQRRHRHPAHRVLRRLVAERAAELAPLDDQSGAGRQASSAAQTSRVQ